MRFAILLLGFALGVHAVGIERRDTPGQWVASWTSMPQLTETSNLPPAPYTKSNVIFQDSTIRATVHISIPGSQIRVRFSNVFGTQPLPITAVTVALPAGGKAGVSAIQTSTLQNVTFSGKASVTLARGTQIDSDPLDFAVLADSNLSITMYLATGQQGNDNTSHPGSRTTSYFVTGNHVSDADLKGSANAAHWYFINSVDVWAKPGAAAIAIVGDSITDGRGSTTDGNNRWTDVLITRLQAQNSTKDLIAVLNQAAGGNRVLQDGLGPSAVSRIDRDVLGITGVKWAILFEGVNDIGTAGANSGEQNGVVSRLTAAYEKIINQVHAKGIKIYGATITPFGGQGQDYDDAGGAREAARQAVNKWILTSGKFDGVIDFDKATRDPNKPRQLQASIDTGDHLHLNPAGYKLMAEAVPLTLFANSTA